MEQPDGREPGPDAVTLGPLSFDRVKAALDMLGDRYFVDSDGDLGGRWDGNDFYFLLGGEQHELLTVRGYWWAYLPTERHEDALRAANDWSWDHWWPTVHVRLDDDGHVRVGTGFTVDWEDGVTDAQIIRQIRTGVSNSCRFFDRLDETFPDAKH